MKNEDVMVLAQLLAAMKDAAEKLGISERKKDAEGLASAKREILTFQQQIKEML
ncbi:MAG: hypothetical protein ABH864_04200 [archaeon]